MPAQFLKQVEQWSINIQKSMPSSRYAILILHLLLCLLLLLLSQNEYIYHAAARLQSSPTKCSYTCCPPRHQPILLDPQLLLHCCSDLLHLRRSQAVQEQETVGYLNCWWNQGVPGYDWWCAWILHTAFNGTSYHLHWVPTSSKAEAVKPGLFFGGWQSIVPAWPYLSVPLSDACTPRPQPPDVIRLASRSLDDARSDKRSVSDSFNMSSSDTDMLESDRSISMLVSKLLWSSWIHVLRRST